MKKLLKAFRKARVYTNNFGGAYVFWDDYWKKWMVVPNPKTPKYEEMYLIKNDEFLNYTTY